MKVQSFFDDGRTYTLTHVVYDEDTRDAVIFDPVLDLDTTPWRTFTESVEKVLAFVKEKDLNVRWILDTHVHADHLSASTELKKHLDAKFAIGSNIKVVQEIFKQAFNLADSFPTDGSQFDALLEDGDVIDAGSIKIEVMHTPGHTPACNCYKIGDHLFTGDVLFAPDVGVARCDFPKGSARDLYHSVTERIYTLPDDTKVWFGHDYPNNRELMTHTTVGDSKRSNVDLPGDIDEETFVSRITERDNGLSAPRLLFPSLQVNINAGELPPSEDNDVAYLKIPLNFL